jgi:hypothetical protein
VKRPLLIALGAALAIALAILLWPPMERETVADGLLPGGARPAVLALGPGGEEPSTAARMIGFAPPGLAVAPADTAATEPAAPVLPPPDALPLLVGVSGRDGALVGYFSYNGRSFRARRGERIDEWKVAALGRRDARLVSGRKALKVGLFQSRSGPLSPALPAPQRPAYVPAAAPVASGAAAPSGRAPAKRRPPPGPPPKGSKGWWTGPRGSMPPGFTPMPKPADE